MRHEANRADHEPDDDGRLHVLVVCSGNICRSPMAEKVLSAAVGRAGLEQAVRVSSAGTGPWHVGQPASRPAQRVLAAAGYPSGHRARQLDRTLAGSAGLLLGATSEHVQVMTELTGRPDDVQLYRSFDPAAGDDQLPDPYYGTDDDYRDVLTMIQAATPRVLAEIRRRLR